MYSNNHFASQNDERADFSFSSTSNQNLPTKQQVESRRNFSLADVPSLTAMPSSLLPNVPPKLPVTQVMAQAERPMARPDHTPVNDEQISALFTAMARASQLNQIQLAQRLQTTPELIHALETGALNDLPEWDEVSAIIVRYTSFMNIDERPVLRRLREQLTEHYLSNLSRGTVQKNLNPQSSHQNGYTGSSIMPQSDLSLKAFANGTPVSSPASNIEINTSPFGNNMQPVNNNMSHHSSYNDGRPLNVKPAMTPRQEQRPQSVTREIHSQREASFRDGHQAPGTPQQFQPVREDYYKPKSNRLVKIAANVAFIIILLVGFVHWQPNRFWSGIDALPKPIANSIYTIFEMVMPDPLAATYRMNWVFVDDPRMRKADRLHVPQVKSLPAIDFSSLRSMTQ